MPKIKESEIDFTYRMQQTYPGVFRSIGTTLKCDVCKKIVTGKKLHSVKQHMETKAHMEAAERQLGTSNNSSGSATSPLGKQMCQMFLQANIPLKKLSHPAVREFFERNIATEEPIPSESTLRRKFVPELYQEKIEELRLKAEGRYIWASIDETTDTEQRQVANFIFGVLGDKEETGKAYLFNMATVEFTNAQTMSQFFNDSLMLLYPKGIQYDKVLLVVTDAAAYMCAAMNGLKTLYPKMLHITCFSHGLHRMAEFVRSKFTSVNELISSTKAVFVKAPSRRNVFKQVAPDIALPPSPCITRWTTWLRAAIYYCDNFETVKKVVDTFDDDDSEAIRKAKNLFKQTKIKTDLAFIKCNFEALINATVKFETQGLELKESVETIEAIRNSLKAMQSKQYHEKLEKILDRNKGFKSLRAIYEVLYEAREPLEEYVKNLSPQELMHFKYAPVSSADVERSFSAYSATLTEKRRSFSFDNLKQHLIVYCNQGQ